MSNCLNNALANGGYYQFRTVDLNADPTNSGPVIGNIGVQTLRACIFTQNLDAATQATQQRVVVTDLAETDTARPE